MEFVHTKTETIWPQQQISDPRVLSGCFKAIVHELWNVKVSLSPLQMLALPADFKMKLLLF